MVDLKEQLRGYTEILDRAVSPVEVEAFGRSEEALREPVPVVWRSRGWVVAVVAAVATLVLVGGIALLVRSLQEGPEPADVPPPTTVVVDVGGGWSVVPTGTETLSGADIRSVIRGGPGLVAVGLQDASVVSFGATATTAPGAAGGIGPGVWLSPDGVLWTRVEPDAIDSQGVGGMFDVTVGGPGLVAVGQVGCAATVWTSEEGLEWTQVPYDESVFGGSLGTSEGVACSSIDRVVAGQAGIVALGRDGTGIEQRVWTSTDGLLWRPLILAESFGPESIFIRHLFAGGSGWVAWGGACEDAEQAAEDEEIEPTCPVAIWTSADGASWVRVPLAEAAFDGADMRSIAEGPNGFLGAGTDQSGVVLWSSRDGLTWERIPNARNVFGSRFPEFLVGDADGFVAVNQFDWECVPIETDEQAANSDQWGCEQTDGRTGVLQPEAQVWLSPDGITWTRSATDLRVPGFGFADDMVKFGSGVIVAAADQEPTRHQVLLRWTTASN